MCRVFVLAIDPDWLPLMRAKGWFCVAGGVAVLAHCWLSQRLGQRLRRSVPFAVATVLLGLLLSKVYVAWVFGAPLVPLRPAVLVSGDVSIWGAVLGVPAAGSLWLMYKLLRFNDIGRKLGVEAHLAHVLALCDASYVAVAIGQLLGRPVCFLNGCCFGRPTNGTFGVVYSFPRPSTFFFGSRALHPVQLYEVVGVSITLAVLVILLRRRVAAGILSSVYLVGYGLTRALAQLWRFDTPDGAPLHASPIVHGLLTCLVGTFCLLAGARTGRMGKTS
jgi:prolipoprotein diacylglyceryltransferase